MDRTVFEDAFKHIRNKRISYQVIHGKDPIKRLLIMSKTEHSGLLAVLHHHHSFFGRLLTHSDTQELLNDQKIPVLIFPAKE
ncbi:MAG: hypothetical protein JSU01_18275 [Bacteroidetes bacterium]|nr:hypothetical protein [Bacteroidota bacterium]